MRTFDFDGTMAMHRLWKMRFHLAVVAFGVLSERIEILLRQLKTEFRQAG